MGWGGGVIDNIQGSTRDKIPLGGCHAWACDQKWRLIVNILEFHVFVLVILLKIKQND